MAEILSYLTPTQLIPLAFIVLCFAFFIYYWRVTRIQDGSLAWIRELGQPRHLTFRLPRFSMTKKDALPLILLVIVYACTAFFRLGDTSAPQSGKNFSPDQTVEITLDAPILLDKMMYFTGLGTGAYNVEVSSDGVSWSTLWSRTDDEGTVTGYYWADAEGYAPSYAMTQKYNQLFKWIEVTVENPVRVEYLRITSQAKKDPMELCELALYDNGTLYDLTDAAKGTEYEALFDEQELVPEKSTYMNSAYFDEIYHPRTAYENIRGVYPYEVSHPPLGKLILSLGIRMFGMTPFGWRFMGTLFGVFMLPLLYVFLKNLFGKTAVSVCGTALFAFDFMHITQTRLATIDTYGVFFLLGAYFFLYRWMTLPEKAKRTHSGKKVPLGVGNLFLSGLFFGLGAASKWTVLYGSVGLAVLYFVNLFLRRRDWPREEGSPRFAPWCAKIILLSVIFFLLIPGCIYILSYLPYAQADGDTSFSNLLSIVLENQKFMLTYHAGVTSPHPYASHWYQWIFDIRPILYFRDQSLVATEGVKSAFAAFLNPIVCWAGLLSVIIVAIQAVRKRCGKALFLFVGYLSQLVPYLFIHRPMFYYHYFPSMLFLVLCIAYAMNDLLEKKAKHAKLAVYGLTGCAMGLTAAFYPVLIGLYVPVWYTTNLLRWFPSWPF